MKAILTWPVLSLFLQIRLKACEIGYFNPIYFVQSEHARWNRDEIYILSQFFPLYLKTCSDFHGKISIEQPYLQPILRKRFLDSIKYPYQSKSMEMVGSCLGHISDPYMGMAWQGWMMIWNWYGVIFCQILD